MGIVETVKDWFVKDEEYEEYEDERVADTEEEEKSTASYFSKKSKVVPLNAKATQSKIVILKPQSFDESKNIADEIKQRMPVIFDVGALEPEDARRVVDFVAGAVYGVDGKVQRVSGGIFVATPNHMEIWGKDKENSSKGEVDWNMF